jgi:hypothetical protein
MTHFRSELPFDDSFLSLILIDTFQLGAATLLFEAGHYQMIIREESRKFYVPHYF